MDDHRNCLFVKVDRREYMHEDWDYKVSDSHGKSSNR